MYYWLVVIIITLTVHHKLCYTGRSHPNLYTLPGSWINQGNVRQRVHRIKVLILPPWGWVYVKLCTSMTMVLNTVELNSTCRNTKDSLMTAFTWASFHKSLFSTWQGNSVGSCIVTIIHLWSRLANSLACSSVPLYMRSTGGANKSANRLRLSVPGDSGTMYITWIC